MYIFSPMMVANSRKHHCRIRLYTREVLVISTNLNIQKNHYPLEITNRKGVEARIKNTWLTDGPTDSVFRPNLRTCPPSLRSPAVNVPVTTVAVTTTVTAYSFAILPPKVRVKSKNLEIFGDSASTGGANANVVGTSKLNEPADSSDSFYASLDLNSETLHRIYVPKWNVTNDSILDNPRHGRCVGVEVRMRVEHTLEQKYILEDKCSEQAALLSKRDTKIAHLKSLLSLKEAEATEAIRLHGQLSVVEADDTATGNELRDLKERNFVLEGEKDVLSEKLSRDELSSKVASLESERDTLADQSPLESAFELFKAIGCAVNKGIQDGLKARVDHGKARRDLAVIEAYDPSAKAKYIDAVNALGAVDFSLLSELKSNKDASMVNLIDSLCLEGPLVETSKAEDLQPGENKEKRLSLTDVMVPLAESLSLKSLIGEASTFATPVTTEPITALSITFTSSKVFPPLLISNDKTLDTKPNDTDPLVLIFEKEELPTSPE
ncbi:hypothetical protein Tco_0637915 [Tanacetum coccineum]